MTDPLEFLQIRSLKHLSGSLQALIKGRLWLQVVIGMLLGAIVGILLGPSVGWVEPKLALHIGNWLALPGKLFLALLQMIVIPLVFASIIRGLAASEDVTYLKKTGLSLALYFVLSTAVAILIGIWLASVVKPGNYVDADQIRATLGAMPIQAAGHSTTPPTFEALPQLIVTVLPTNPLGSMVEGQMLQIVLFGIIFGLALVMMSPVQSKPLLDLLGSLQEVCMTIVRWALWLAPFAVFGLIAQLSANVGINVLAGLGVYAATVLAGLMIILAAYVAIVSVVSHRSPMSFLRGSRELLLLAFSTSSSAAVMPVSIRVAEEKFNVRPSISQLVIPLGATMNMNGTALYQGVATVFLAQIFGVDLGFSGMLLIVLIAVGASIGSPGTPGVGIVILAVVLGSVGIPAAAVALLMGVDRILDMSRTAVNVAGDLVACVLMDAWVGGKRTASEQLAEESAREWQRKATGRNVWGACGLCLPLLLVPRGRLDRAITARCSDVK